MREIYVEKKGSKKEIYIVEDGSLTEVYFEDEKNSRIGNIYLGRVVNVLSGMDACFIDLGIGKNGYLPISEIPDSNGKKITDLLVGGREIVVQVIKEERGGKGVKLTQKIEISGDDLVYTPMDERLGISKKIKSSKSRERLKNIVEDLELDGGIVFRTSAEKMETEDLKEDILRVKNLYMKLEAEKNFLPVPRLLHRENEVLKDIIKNKLDMGLDRIVVNDKGEFKNLEVFLSSISDDLKSNLHLNSEFEARYDKTINDGINEGLSRKVKLKNGGSLVIDELEALTVIDVNTGGYVGDLSLEQTVLNLNLEAGVEVARQIRLRNLAGIILVDFIDMKKEVDMDKVIQLLKNHFKLDFIKVNIIGFTKLGLLEITREKKRKTLSEELSVECENCFGIGKIREK